jgi:hypothetical protein
MFIRPAISSATKQFAKPFCPWNCGGINVLLAKAFAMRWASSKAWMPEKTELLVVVIAVFSISKFQFQLVQA